MEIYQETTSLPDHGHTERMDDVTALKKPPLCFHALAVDVGDHPLCVGRTLRRHRSPVGPGNDGEHRLAGRSSRSVVCEHGQATIPAPIAPSGMEQVQYKRMLDDRSALPIEFYFIASARESWRSSSNNPCCYACCAKQIGHSKKASSPSLLPAASPQADVSLPDAEPGRSSPTQPPEWRRKY